MIKFTKTKDCPYLLEDAVGIIPFMLNEDDQRTAEQQLDAGYAHGGGFKGFNGFKLLDDNSIKYPGDSKHKPWAIAKFRDDLIVVYESAWVAVIHPDRSFTISRMD